MIKAKPLKLESASKRLRSVIYLRWLRAEKGVNQEDYYQQEMEKIISEQKQKIT